MVEDRASEVLASWADGGVRRWWSTEFQELVGHSASEVVEVRASDVVEACADLLETHRDSLLSLLPTKTLEGQWCAEAEHYRLRRSSCRELLAVAYGGRQSHAVPASGRQFEFFSSHTWQVGGR